MKKKIVIFNGIHGSGKSTLAYRLAKRDGAFEYFPEIGGQLRLALGSNALESPEDFDREIMRLEGTRDEELALCPRIPLVETWHVGNLAYVRARNPQLERAYRSLFEVTLRRFSVFSVFVDISWETFRMRATEKIVPSQMDELVAFYENVLAATHRLYKEYSIPYATVRNEGSLDGVTHAVQLLLENQKPSS
jgi:thymidylate kinase